MTNQDGSLNASYGAATTYQRLDPVWLRKIIATFTTIDPGSVPVEDLNNVLNQFGIQPVALVQRFNKPMYMYQRGFYGGGSNIQVFNDTEGSANQTNIHKSSGLSATTVTAGTGVALYTVTSGKTLHLTDITIMDNSNNGASGVQNTIGDGSITTPLITTMINGTGNNVGFAGNVRTYKVPVQFTTSVFIDSSFTHGVWWELHGWEQ